jgi:hypothetical protein
MKKLFVLAAVALAVKFAPCVALAQNNPPPFIGYTPSGFLNSLTITSTPSSTFPLLVTNAPNWIEVPAESIVVAEITTSAVTNGATATNGTTIFYLRGSLDGITPAIGFPYSITTTNNSSNVVTHVVALATNVPYRFLSIDKTSTDHTGSVYFVRAGFSFMPYRR